MSKRIKFELGCQSFKAGSHLGPLLDIACQFIPEPQKGFGIFIFSHTPKQLVLGSLYGRGVAGSTFLSPTFGNPNAWLVGCPKTPTIARGPAVTSATMPQGKRPLVGGDARYRRGAKRDMPAGREYPGTSSDGGGLVAYENLLVHEKD